MADRTVDDRAGWGIKQLLLDLLWFLARFIAMVIAAALVILALSLLLGFLMTRWLSGGWVQGGIFFAALAMLAVSYRGFLWDFAGFCVARPVQSVTLALVFALVYAQVGNGLGLPGLFWSEDPVTRFFVAMAATLVLGLIGLNAYYLIRPEDYDAIASAVEDALGDPEGDAPRGWPRTLSRWAFVDSERWLDPRRSVPPSNPYRLGRFLRLVRLPFLTLLAMPALLPAFFVNVPRTAPIVLNIDTMTLFGWSDRFRPDVASDPVAYALGASWWLLGIWVAVQVIKAFIRVSDWFSRDGGAAIRPPKARSVLTYASFAAVVYLTMALSPLYSGEWFRKDGTRIYLVVGAVLLCVAPMLLALVEYLRARRMQGDDAAILKVTARILLVIGILELILFGPVGLLLSGTGFRGVAPAVAILALLGMVALLTALFGLTIRDPRWRVLGLVLILAVVSYNNRRIDQYRFERLDYTGLEGGKREGYPLNGWVDRLRRGGDGEGMVPDRVALTNWKRRVEGTSGSPDGRPKLVVVCVSGGAIRSAYWSATVVDRIGRGLEPAPGGEVSTGEEPRPRVFDRHVRIITGASGGMVGMPYYVKWLRDGLWRNNDAAIADDGLDPTPWQSGGGDTWASAIPPFSLRPVARYIALREVPYMAFRRLLGIREDRGVVLERDWEALRFPISALAEAERAGALPSLIFSPMTVEDGRRLLISNLDLRFLVNPALPPPGLPASPLALNRGSDLSAANDGTGLSDYSLSAIEFAKVFPHRAGGGEPPNDNDNDNHNANDNDLYLSTAARMSATFPYVSPAVYLPSDPPLRVVDAGYYDNYGVDVATAWLFRNRDWIARETSGVLMVQARDSLSVADRFDFPETPEGTYAKLLRGVQFFFSPIEGVARARYASSSFRNDAQVAALSDYFAEQTGSRSFFTTAIFELSTSLSFPGDPDANDWPGDRLDEMLRAADASGSSDVAMSWYLTVAERKAIEEAIPDYTGLLPLRDARPTYPGMGTPGALIASEFGIDGIPIEAIDISDPAGRRKRIAQLRELGAALQRKLRDGSTDATRDSKHLAVVTRALNRASSYEAIERIREWWGTDQYGSEQPGAPRRPSWMMGLESVEPAPDGDPPPGDRPPDSGASPGQAPEGY